MKTTFNFDFYPGYMDTIYFICTFIAFHFSAVLFLGKGTNAGYIESCKITFDNLHKFYVNKQLSSMMKLKYEVS